MKAIIIGAGIAGLSAGILLRENGIETEIFEMHTLPGGLCTAWRRGGYTFDGCIRYVYGSGEGRMMHALMRRVGVAGTREFVEHEESIRVETTGGETVIFHCDLDRLEAHLLELSPQDAKVIRKLIRDAKSTSRADLPMGTPSNVRDVMTAMAHFVPQVLKYSGTSMAAFAGSLKSPALREAFLHYYGYSKLDELPLFALVMDLAERHARNAGWPLGGSLDLMRDVEKKYVALGGKVRYGCKVAEILTEGNRAAGIRLADGETHKADIVISAADAYTTLQEMLGGRYTPPAYRDAFRSEELIAPILQVSLGIGMDLSHAPHSQAVALREPIEVAGIRYDWLSFKHYGYDKSMAPQGKSTVVAVLETDFSAWEALSRGSERYRMETESAAAQVVARLSDRYPGLADKVEQTDVATPLTWLRYTGNHKGSPQGWQTKPGHMESFPYKLPGLDGFYMAGQWVRRGGGLPGGAMSALETVRRICKDNKLRFQ